MYTAANCQLAGLANRYTSKNACANAQKDHSSRRAHSPIPQPSFVSAVGRKSHTARSALMAVRLGSAAASVTTKVRTSREGVPIWVATTSAANTVQANDANSTKSAYASTAGWAPATTQSASVLIPHPASSSHTTCHGPTRKSASVTDRPTANLAPATTLAPSRSAQRARHDSATGCAGNGRPA